MFEDIFKRAVSKMKRTDAEMLLIFYRVSKSNRLMNKLVLTVYKYSSFVFFFIYVLAGADIMLNNFSIVRLIPFLFTPAFHLVFTLFLRRLIKRPRPFTALHLPPPPDKRHKVSFSFPSNHSSSASTIAFACMFLYGNLGVCVFILAVVTGLSRLFLAAHYPSDVFAGFIISGLFAVLGFHLLPVFIMSLL